MEELIRLEDLSYTYHAGQENERPVLKHVDLSIRRGEFLAILGANGSGKSTLAKHLNAILIPTGGRCIVHGIDTRETEELWRIRQQVGMVFQNPDNQMVAAVVEDDVAFGPENLGIPPDEIRRRVDAALRAVGMEDYRDFAPHRLSGGQKQRVAIAGALAMETDCIVFDEPTAMLDPRGHEEVMATVKQLHRERGITVIYITHFMEEAAEAERVIVLEKGSIALQGTPREVFTQVEQLKRMKLDVPMAAEMAYRLRQKGVKLPKDVLTEEELAEALCQSGWKM